jgi:two-component system chemotaxis response regulator CheY
MFDSKKKKTPRTAARAALVAVSDPVARASAAQALEDGRFEVQTAAEWTSAVEKVESERFDVVIAEVEMPVVGGLDLLKAIRSNRPGTLVFLLGRDTAENGERRARNLGAAGYLKKPVKRHELALQVATASEEVHNKRMLTSLGIRGGKLRMVS